MVTAEDRVFQDFKLAKLLNAIKNSQSTSRVNMERVSRVSQTALPSSWMSETKPATELLESLHMLTSLIARGDFIAFILGSPI
jgi:hypothetical protein